MKPVKKLAPILLGIYLTFIAVPGSTYALLVVPETDEYSFDFNIDSDREVNEGAEIHEISSCEELQNMSEMGENTDTYILTQSIDCEDFDEDGLFEPISWGEAPFSGTLDGQNFTVENVTITGEYELAGLFAYAIDATFTNLALTNIDYDVSSNFVGGLLGFGSGVYVEELYVEGSIDIPEEGCNSGEFFCAFGGIIGTNHPFFLGDFELVETGIANSYTDVDITTADTGELYMGGIGGVMFATLTGGVYSKGDLVALNGETYTGGLYGAAIEFIVFPSFSISEITNIGGISAGIVAYGAEGTIEDTYWYDPTDGERECSHEFEEVGGVDAEECYSITDLDGGLDYFKDIENEPLPEWDFESIWSIDEEINEGFPYLTFTPYEDEEEEEEEVEEEEEPAPARRIINSGGSSSTSSKAISKGEASPAPDNDDSPVSSPNRFSDTGDHWSKDFAEKLNQKCGVNGYADEAGNLLGEFRPDENISRAELVAMLISCKYGTELPEFDSEVFPDVNDSDWFYKYIAIAKSLGWITGYEDGTFKPNSPVTRAEAAKIIIRSQYPDEEIQISDFTFTDTDPAEWYAKYIGFGVFKKLFAGYLDSEGNPTGEFGPGNNITRGEAAKVIVNTVGI